MNVAKFSFYSGLGAGIWVIVLVALGYLLGSKEELINEHLQNATLLALISVVFITLFYIIRVKRRKKILKDQ